MSSALRNFFVVFFLSLLGFGILGHIVATVTVPAFIKDESGSSASADTDQPDSEPPADGVSGAGETSNDGDISQQPRTAGEKFDFAFFCFGSDSGLAGIYLLHIDGASNTCVRVRIPGSASVENSGASYSLASLCDSEGRDFVLTKLYYLTGCRIDEYASLCAVDTGGMGRDLTRLSTYLGYTYKLASGFDYPNPYYGLGSEDNSTEGVDYDSEYIQLKPGSYALNGVTDGVQNDTMLLDTRRNESAFDIFADFLERVLNDKGRVGSFEQQRDIFEHLPEKSFRDYANSGAAHYLFGDFKKVLTCPYSGRSGAWDEIRKAVRG